jgi:hypothetical protein
MPLDLLRSVDPAKYRHEDSESLVMRLKFTNVSGHNAFAPLERAFVREQAAPLDRSYIATSRSERIGLFPLAVDSEWSIQGQEFPVLNPGESVETLIASEPGVSDRLSDEMIWRARVRIGPYRSDVLGVKFTKTDVVP